jgi:putative RNA 2'-phosphotransferase
VLFPEESQPGVDLILPDFGYIDDRLADVEAVNARQDSTMVAESAHQREALDTIVAENNKSRFQIAGLRIRAVQGHSEGTPVTREGLERSWEVVSADDPVFHGTTIDAARSILVGEGIHSAARSHVHLAPATTSVVGKRHEVQVLLVVSPVRLRAAGQTLWRAPNGVLLTRAVPAGAIVDVLASHGDDERVHALKGLLRPGQ